MRLSADFPHTRYEQYLMVLPARLLTSAEALIKQRVVIRLRYYLRGLVLPLVAEAVARGLTVEDWAVEFVATFEGSLPPAFDARHT
jgi:hypothetical protein